MKRKYLILAGIVLALLVVAGGFYFWQQSSTASAAATTRQTATVARGELTASVSGAGNISAPETSNLSFGIDDASVTEVNVRVGDSVKTGDVLARATAAQYEEAVKSARLNLESAQAALKALLAPATESELATAQAQVNAAQASYDSAVASLNELKNGANSLDIQSAQASLASAQENYKSALAKSEMTDQQIIVARAALETARINLESAQSAYNAIAWQENATSSSAAKELQTATIAYESARAAYDLNLAAINNSALKTAEATLASARSSLNTLTAGATAEEIAVAQAAVGTAKASLLQAQSGLRDLQAGATDQERLTAQANVNSAQTALDGAQRTLDSANITAPFDGVISAVSTFAGQKVTAGTTAIGLVNTGKLQTQVTLSEVDVAEIKAGQDVELSFDALGDGVYPGVVTAVSPVGTTTSGVVNYTVTIAISNPDPKILPGMTVLANIITEQKDDAVYVPNRAVKTQNNRKVVTLLFEGKEIPLIVTTGMTNSSFTEIVGAAMQDGTAVTLREGDTLVLNATATSSTRQGVRGPGGPPGDVFP